MYSFFDFDVYIPLIIQCFLSNYHTHAHWRLSVHPFSLANLTRPDQRLGYSTDKHIKVLQCGDFNWTKGGVETKVMMMKCAEERDAYG